MNIAYVSDVVKFRVSLKPKLVDDNDEANKAHQVSHLCFFFLIEILEEAHQPQANSFGFFLFP